MGFLDKVKKNTTEQTTDKTEVATPVAKNPFAKNPLAGKPNPLTNTKKAEEKTEEVKTKVTPKPNPFAKKDNTEKKETVVVPKANPFAKKAAESKKEETKTEVVETKEEVKTEIVETTPQEDSTKETEQQEDIVAEGNLVKDEAEVQKEMDELNEATKPKAEEKSDSNKGNKKSSRKSSKKTNGKKEETKTEASDSTVTTIPTTEISYADAIASIRSPFVDEEWDAFRVETEKALADINIEADMNSATLKKTIAVLSKLRQKIWSPYQDTKSLYEQLTSREPEGLIERIKKVNLGEGTSNDLQRKKAGVEACMNYIPPQESSPINLYEVLDETRARYNFLKNCMSSIDFKAQALITMNGALKLENNLS